MSTPVVPQRVEGLDIQELAIVLWRAKWVLAGCAIAAGLLAGVIAALLPPTYRSEAVLQIREEANGGNALRSLAGQFGSLGALAGLSIGNEGDQRSVALATLKSRTIIEKFIEKEGLLPILYDGRWDAQRSVWKTNFLRPEPNVQDAYKRFMSKVLSVDDDRRTGLVTVGVEWKDPEQSKAWVDGVVADANALLKERTVTESESNLRYLEEQAKKVTIVQLQSALYTLMEQEYKRRMMASNSEDYVFRVIDSADVPVRRIRPKVPTIVALASLLGFLAGASVIVIRKRLRLFG